MKRPAMMAVAGILGVVFVALPAQADDVRYGTILAGGGTQDCATNIGCGLWADGTTCNPNHPFGHSNMWGHAYNLRDPMETDKQVDFTLTSVSDAGAGDPFKIVFHTRDVSCAPIGPSNGTAVYEMAQGESKSFGVPGDTKWMVVYMIGTSSVQIGFQVRFDHCTTECVPAA